MKNTLKFVSLIITIYLSMGTVNASINTGRVVILLNGVWQIEEGEMDKIPTKFNHEVVVPGLIDMAKPAFIEPGPEVANRGAFSQKDLRRDAFWYRRTFQITDTIPDVAKLKVGKAKYGTRVFLNGKLIGDHAPCFTAGYFNVKDILKNGENELIIRIGADRDAVSGIVESGFDGEKSRYIPGIYDNVELIMSGSPHIVNIQAVPDIVNHSVTVHSWICLPFDTGTNLHIIVREAVSKMVVGEADCSISTKSGDKELTGSIKIPIKGCHLWSPEDPFLYEVEVHSSEDNFITRFGMRSFRFDPETGLAMLNGKPYYMRGSNVNLLRFFEDPARGDKPWREEWVRRLLIKFKDMHWNSLRYCIGFAPELWYRIADEEGILIQDEYPIWYASSFKPDALKADVLAVEYREWMEERWNHPCVVIWDAANETYTPETGKAIRQVRALDFSNRPWDNGWGEPVDVGDPDECHPYHFIFGPNQPFRLKDLANDPGTKAGVLIAQPYEKEKLLRNNPLIINEYGGIWLNRDGTPTTLSKNIYDYLQSPSATVEQRRLLYARTMAAITEFFRAHRQVAGVMHFCGLGYSRSDGQTSDDWVDLEKLIWNREFYTYVRDAFAPIGLMLNVWDDELPGGQTKEFPVIIFNDLEKSWKGEVKFTLSQNGKIIYKSLIPIQVEGFGTSKFSFKVSIPEQSDNYQAEVTLVNTPFGPVRSLRDFSVLTPEQHEARRNIAKDKPVKASSATTKDKAEYGVDGNRSSSWTSKEETQPWFAIDLAEIQSVSRIELSGRWGFIPNNSSIQVSNDGKNWSAVYTKLLNVDGIGNIETFRFETTQTRWIRLLFPDKEGNISYSLTEFAVYK